MEIFTGGATCKKPIVTAGLIGADADDAQTCNDLGVIGHTLLRSPREALARQTFLLILQQFQ